MYQDYLYCRVVTYDNIKAPTYSFALDVTIPESTTVIVCALKPLAHMVTFSSIQHSSDLVVLMSIKSGAPKRR